MYNFMGVLFWINVVDPMWISNAFCDFIKKIIEDFILWL